MGAVLDVGQVNWNSIDPVRIGYVDELSAPLVLWIGIRPDSQVPYEVNYSVAAKCKALLVAHGTKDVEVEMRKSWLVELDGPKPKLLQPADDNDPTVVARRPFTCTLGTPICAQSTSWAQGTAGFFISERGNDDKVYFVTARHVVLPRSQGKPYDNKHYERKFNSQRPSHVMIFNQSSFGEYLDSIQDEIDGQDDFIEYHSGRVSMTGNRQDEDSVEDRQDAQAKVRSAEEKKIHLANFRRELSIQWGGEDSRILGHIIFSPPVAFGVGNGKYTRDLAVIAVDTSRIDPTKFIGNAIDLGFKFWYPKLTKIMRSHPVNSERFLFPVDRLLRLHGTIPEEEIRHPDKLDRDPAGCLIVLKLGGTTGLTIGRANNVFSYTRRDKFSENNSGDSMEWAILPFDHSSGAFSAAGDSGSAIVDGTGRIGGLLTSGSGATDSIDVTYATPIDFVLETIRSSEPLSKAYLKPSQ